MSFSDDVDATKYDFDDGDDRKYDSDVMANRLDEVVKRVPDLDQQALYEQVKLEESQMDASNRKNIYQNQNQAMIENSRRFRDMTQTLGNYNEAYNSNTYLYNNMEAEKKRVGRLAQMARNDLHAANQTYLRENYKHQLYIFLANIILYTIVAMSTGYAVLSESSVLTRTVSYIVFAVIVLAYAVAVTFETYRHSMRLNPYHWNRLYFKTGIEREQSEGGGKMTTKCTTTAAPSDED